MWISRALAAGPEQPGMDTISPELFFMLLAILIVPLVGWGIYAAMKRRRAGST
ncbi:MAG TPA: hypothetical protein VF601_00790 [Beijerinckiaceae bacterium]|jgi:hypothetical protein